MWSRRRSRPGPRRTPGDVRLNVSTGADPAEQATVPRAAGQRLDEGRRTLEQAGFEVLALTIGDDEIRNESTIASQSPGAGASIPGGTSCSSTSSGALGTAAPTA